MTPFWNYLKSQKEENIGVAPLKSQGQLHSDRATKCEILADQFKSVFTRDEDDPYQGTRLFGPAYQSIAPLRIGEEGVRKLLAGINPSKASGPDEIPCRLLKELADQLAPAFTHLFTQSLTTGELSDQWTMAGSLQYLRRAREVKLRTIGRFH